MITFEDEVFNERYKSLLVLERSYEIEPELAQQAVARIGADSDEVTSVCVISMQLTRIAEILHNERMPAKVNAKGGSIALIAIVLSWAHHFELDFVSPITDHQLIELSKAVVDLVRGVEKDEYPKIVLDLLKISHQLNKAAILRNN